MQGYLSLVLHAHLPFVRHPEHEKFLEESWLFEAVTETYIPLLQMLEGWRRDGMDARLTLSLSPTLCAMLLDPLLRERYERHLNSLIELAEKEIHRTHWDRAFRELAWMYHHRFTSIRDTWRACEGNLVGAFRKFQDEGRIEIITTAATHALLPLLASHPPSIRAQILTARDHYRSCFGRDPRGIWLPECAYAAGVEIFLQEANIRWFILDTHGVLHARPRPRYGTFAPIFTPNGIAAFGRDFDSSRQVWSKHEGYPGDPRYRDFYRDIGFDLDFDYVKPHLPSPENRGFTGMKYYRITGGAGRKADLPARRWRLQAASRTRRSIFWTNASSKSSGSPGFWTARRSSSRRMTRNCSAIGGMKGRNFSIIFARKLSYDQKDPRADHARRISAPPSDQPDRHAQRVELGRGRLLARVAERNERMDLSAPASRAGAHDRAGARNFPNGDRPEGAGVEAGRARTAAGAGQRLAVHFARRHQPRLRAPPGEGPSAALHRAARPVDRDGRGRKMAGTKSSRATTFSPTWTGIIGSELSCLVCRFKRQICTDAKFDCKCQPLKTRLECDKAKGLDVLGLPDILIN